MAASKAKSGSSSRKRTTTRSRKAQNTQTVVAEHVFAPGAKVGIYEPQQAEIERRDERDPAADPLQTVTVAKDGDLKVSGLKPGTYTAVGKVAETGGRFGARFAHLTFVVKEPKRK